MGTRDGEVLTAARRADVAARFLALIHHTPVIECHLWTGAISGRGHGRFWISNKHVIVAHRFAYALANPTTTELPAVIAHACDNPFCQNPDHLEPADALRNRRQWAGRRHTIHNPHRDTRGPLDRALDIRAAARNGGDILAALTAGEPALDRQQPTLW